MNVNTDSGPGPLREGLKGALIITSPIASCFCVMRPGSVSVSCVLRVRVVGEGVSVLPLSVLWRVR